MGMDLITIGYTVIPKQIDRDAVAAYVRSVTLTEENLDDIDAAGLYDEEQEVRDAIVEGLDFFGDAARMSTLYPLPGTALTFVIAGGGSWGDQPFEGFTSLSLLSAACGVLPELADLVGYICPGLPHVNTLANALVQPDERQDGGGFSATEAEYTEALRARGYEPYTESNGGGSAIRKIDDHEVTMMGEVADSGIDLHLWDDFFNPFLPGEFETMDAYLDAVVARFNELYERWSAQ